MVDVSGKEDYACRIDYFIVCVQREEHCVAGQEHKQEKQGKARARECGVPRRASLMAGLRKCRIHSSTLGSDHRPIALDLDLGVL